VLTSGLPAPPPSKVYELWLLGKPVAKPSGLLSKPENGQTTPVPASGLVRGYQLGVTVEPAGGTLTPTTTPILIMPLPA
jgi:anti-sigma-K factor RskA